MFEKVNPSHPDKVADRIAGALVDLAYMAEHDPKVAVEVLLGHKKCFIIIESNVAFAKEDVEAIVERIAGNLSVDLVYVPQDVILAGNQKDEVRCGDNGIFKGVPVTPEQLCLSIHARAIYEKYPYDGKYIMCDDEMTICQSNAKTEDLQDSWEGAIVNPLGDWTGGSDVDAGATNRKLGSDMGDAVTGGGLHGKDLSKADVSVNIWCYLQAQKLGKEVTAHCSIGDKEVNGVPFAEIVEVAREYIQSVGGFERFACWGLI